MDKLPENERAARKRKPGVAGKLTASFSRQAKYALRLYISGSTLKSARAVENVKRVCEQHLTNRYHLEVIDLYQQPNLARIEQIVAAPTLIKRLPAPLRRLVGDMSDEGRVLAGLDLR